MIMNFISRLISTHKLLLLNFYSYLQKYLRPKQENILFLFIVIVLLLLLLLLLLFLLPVHFPWFYPFSILHVTYLLAIMAQSCHELTPPDVIEPLVRDLANNFVSDRSSTQVVAVGYAFSPSIHQYIIGNWLYLLYLQLYLSIQIWSAMQYSIQLYYNNLYILFSSLLLYYIILLPLDWIQSERCVRVVPLPWTQIYCKIWPNTRTPRISQLWWHREV